MPLTWSQSVVTFKRPDMLLRCLKLGAEQSRPPAEIVVVDASPDWDKTRDRVMAELAPRHPEIRWVYEKAIEPNIAIQRNQALGLVTSDITIAPDDDSLLYPDAAEEILRAYEADVEGKVVGIMTLLADDPPDVERPAPPAGLTSNGPPREPFATKIKRTMARANDWVKGPILPESLRRERHPGLALPGLDLPFTQTPVMHGCRMSFRSEVGRRHPYDPSFRFIHEETEMCLRAGTEGAFLVLFTKSIHHAQFADRVFTRRGRRSRALWLLGHAHMMKKHMNDDREARRFVKQYASRVGWADLLLGIARRDLGPWKGVRDAMPGIRAILEADRGNVEAVFLEQVKALPNPS